MPRNRYTKVVRDIERERIVRQEKGLAVLTRKLCAQDAKSTTIPLVNKAKERRSARVEQKQRHKPKRQGDDAGIEQKQLNPTRVGLASAKPGSGWA